MSRHNNTRRRSKWLAYRALEGQTRRTYHPSDHPRPLVHMGLFAAASLLALVCALNDEVATPQMQTIAQALFCVLAGGLYATSMLLIAMARAVLECVGELRPLPAIRHEEEEEGKEEEDATLPAVREEASSGAPKHDNADNIIMDNNSNDDDDEWYDVEMSNSARDVGGGTDNRSALPRETVVASMYFGGLGMFLALGPLCMWNGDASIAFMCALLLLSAALEPISHRLTHSLLMLAVVLVLMLIIGVQVSSPLRSKGVHSFADNPHVVAQLAALPRLPSWPFVLMVSTSPALLYMGSGAGLHAFHSMPPSKTLETGLPICLLMACIVLSWFNPIEMLVVQELLHMRSWVLMSLLAPPLLVIVLVLLVQMMRSRSILTGLAVLAAVFAVRQQTLRVGPVRALDAGALTCAGVAFVLAGARLIRRSI